MNKQIIITLEVDSDDEYCMMDAFIKDDLATEIGCCSNFYEIKDICIGASAEPKTPSNGSITSMNTEKMHVRTTDDCISRQEAKDAIDMALDHIDHVPPWVYDKLLNALNEVPSAEKAQLSGEDATKDATSDLISKNEATTIPVMPKEHREYQTMNLDDAYEQGWFDCQKCIEELSSVEPTIIRCRDCKHHDGIRCFRWNSTIITGFDDFCSNAEKRGEEDE